MTLVATNIPAIVDRLGTLKAAVSDLNVEQDVLKADLIEFAADTGERALEGQLFRATVSFADKRVVDWRAALQFVADVAGLSEAVVLDAIRRHTSLAEGVPCVRVSARRS